MDFKTCKCIPTHRMRKSCFQGSRDSPEVTFRESNVNSAWHSGCLGTLYWLNICTKLAVTLHQPKTQSIMDKPLGCILGHLWKLGLNCSNAEKLLAVGLLLVTQPTRLTYNTVNDLCKCVASDMKSWAHIDTGNLTFPLPICLYKYCRR